MADGRLGGLGCLPGPGPSAGPATPADPAASGAPAEPARAARATVTASAVRDAAVPGHQPGRRPVGRPGGRPTVMTPDRITAARQLLLTHSVTDTARRLGVSRSTLYAHLAEISEAPQQHGAAAPDRAGPPRDQPGRDQWRASNPQGLLR